VDLDAGIFQGEDFLKLVMADFDIEFNVDSSFVELRDLLVMNNE
jgi:hypothetical protein